jgi:hypothetical protein
VTVKVHIAEFRIGAHVLIRDISDEAWMKAHEIAIELIRDGHRPEVGLIVSPEGEEVGVRVLLIRKRDFNDITLPHVLRLVVEQMGLEVE